MVRVLIVDDHAVVRSGLALLLDAAGDLETVGQAGTIAEAVARAGELEPDVVLLDLRLGRESGIDALAPLRRAAPGARVLVLSMEDDLSYPRAALAAGASGYVRKEAGEQVLLEALREVGAGGRYVDPVLGARLAGATEASDGDDDPLSQREREVLRLLALGHTNQQIAELLVISVRTAESHRAHIMQKLRLDTRAELVRWALDRGVLGS